MIKTFDPRHFERPFKKEKVKEDSNTIVYNKVYLGKYKGMVDAHLRLLYSDGMDINSRGGVYFYKGAFKEGFGIYEDVIRSPKRFKDELTKYFSRKLSESFGDYLDSLIINSNLPEKQRNAVQGLLDSRS